jgi:perosamine synthetase
LNKKYIRSSRPLFPREDIEKIVVDIATSIESGRFRNGKNLSTFEKLVAEYIGVKNAVAFDADDSALETALRYYDVRNREVIVCTNSFISIPNSVLYAGGKVVFADIRADTLSMDPKSLLQNITDDTCGVIVTHIAGFPNPDLKEIIKICRKHDLLLIEDATHAIGATIGGKKVGTFGEAAVFAFTPTKVLTTGEGGMLITDNSELAEYARKFLYYGSGPGKTNFVNLGRHMMLPEISAILGVYQIKRVEEFIAKRNHIAKIYNETLDGNAAVKTVKCSPSNRCSYYKYPLILSEKIDKAKFTQLLENEFGIETGNVFYPPCHLQTVYRKLAGINDEHLLTSEQVLYRTITLPMHVTMTNEDATYVAESVNTLLQIALKRSFC